MAFIEMEDVLKEIDNCKKEALESLVNIKADNEIEAIFKKCFGDIAKSLIDSNFERLRQRIESKQIEIDTDLLYCDTGKKVKSSNKIERKKTTVPDKIFDDDVRKLNRTLLRLLKKI